MKSPPDEIQATYQMTTHLEDFVHVKRTCTHTFIVTSKKSMADKQQRLRSYHIHNHEV